jgi:uncharacterized protein (TIGR03118 family)
MRSWLTHWWGALRRPRVRRQPPHYRPLVEGLDDRLAPAHGFFGQMNLVSNMPGVAPVTDPDLVNPWGILKDATSASIYVKGSIWVADNGKDVATQYDYNVNGLPFGKLNLVVSIPGGKPTALVANNTTDFGGLSIGDWKGVQASVIFASEGGQIIGWSEFSKFFPVKEGQICATVPGAVFKGLALGNVGSRNLLYAADFKNRMIRVFDGHFTETRVPGGFRDRNIPRNFAPFNIQNLRGRLYVTYAKQKVGGTDDARGRGNGFIDVFDMQGKLLRRLASRGPLNSPWGLALAPAGFGKASGKLLVGNYGDGKINVYSPVAGRLLGQLASRAGRPIKIDGLWGLSFDNGVTAGQPNVLYFTAGPHQEKDGLFGSLTAIRNGRLVMP